LTTETNYDRIHTSQLTEIIEHHRRNQEECVDRIPKQVLSYYAKGKKDMIVQELVRKI
jgi:hypothetical protein